MIENLVSLQDLRCFPQFLQAESCIRFRLVPLVTKIVTLIATTNHMKAGLDATSEKPFTSNVSVKVNFSLCSTKYPAMKTYPSFN